MLYWGNSGNKLKEQYRSENTKCISCGCLATADGCKLELDYEIKQTEIEFEK